MDTDAHDFRDRYWKILYAFHSLLALERYQKFSINFKNIEKAEVEEAEDVNPNNTIFDSGLIYASARLKYFLWRRETQAGVPVNKIYNTNF